MRSPSEKNKSIPIEANRLFKPSESLGMCDADLETVYDLYDRVVTVRLGTGVPLGTRGTIIGMMLGQTHLDTFYEVLFDHLPKNSLDAILLGGHNQQCRIKVRSYHLANYSHSLRVRSMSNYQPQRSLPTENAWEKKALEQSTPSRSTQNQQQQQPTPTRILKRTPNETNPIPTPKSAPTLTETREKTDLVENTSTTVKEQGQQRQPIRSLFTPKSTEKSTSSQPVLVNPLTIFSSKENSFTSPPPVTKLPKPEVALLTMNPVSSKINQTAAPSTAILTNPKIESFLSRAIKESDQITHDSSSQQQLNNQPAHAIFQQPLDLIPLQQSPIVQQKPNTMSTTNQRSWEQNPAAMQQQQMFEQLLPRQPAWDTSPVPPPAPPQQHQQQQHPPKSSM